MIIDTHFAARDLILLSAGLIFCAGGLITFISGKYKTGLLLVTAGGFCFRIDMAFIDPFLNIWDEQFHALVAKNMVDDPFHPVLVKDPLFPTDPSYWAYTYTWIHKPPFFLWLMAISAKVFGASYWSIRIPSVILSTLMIPAIYRMGKHIGGELTGAYSALLLACSNLLINVNSGFLNTDQNDAVFIALVTFSFWSWMEYTRFQSARWIILTGILSGLAVLTKWIPGFAVYGAWGIYILFTNARALRYYADLVKSFVLSITLALIWFGYAAIKWPIEWKVTVQAYSEHLGQVVEGHDGDALFHLSFWMYNHNLIILLLTIAGFALLCKHVTTSTTTWTILAVISVIFLFYSAAATKMPFFCAIVYPLIYLGTGHFIGYLQQRMSFLSLKFRSSILFALGILLTFQQLNIGRLEHYHTLRDPKEQYRKTRLNNSEIFSKLNNAFPESTVVFNCGGPNSILCMFYTGYTAYDFIPTQDMIEVAKKSGRPLVIFDDGHLPAFYYNDPDITLIKDQLIRNGF